MLRDGKPVACGELAGDHRDGRNSTGYESRTTSDYTVDPAELSKLTGVPEHRIIRAMGVCSHGRVEDACYTLRAFNRWIEGNGDAWHAMVNRAIERAEGGKRWSGAELVEYVRSKDYIDVCGEFTSVNNDYAPITARVLCRDYPELRELVEMRASVYDYLIEGGHDNEC